MMQMNDQRNDDEAQKLEDGQDQEELSEVDENDQDDYYDRNLASEMKEALLKSKVILQKAIFSYAYYRLSKMILNYFAKKIFSSNNFFYWDIFKFSEIVAKK